MEGTTEHVSSSLDLTDKSEKELAEKKKMDKSEESIRSSLQVKSKTNNAVEAAPSTDAPQGTLKSRAKKSVATGSKPSEIAVPPREPVEISLRTLLQAGVHFGHQTSRWSPAMAPFIHSSRNGIHIINLPRTVQSWEKAREKIVEVTSRGGSILFVGTKKQAQDPVVEEARRCGAFYVSRRWLGGMMTNFQTIRKSIDRLAKLERLIDEEQTAQTSGAHVRFTKKERLMMARERDKLEFSLGGIRTMNRAPQLMFVVDVKREEIAIREANRLDIPVIALVDTNCDPRTVRYAIPANDDGTRSIRLFCAAIADAAMEGKKQFDSRRSMQPVVSDFAPSAVSSTASQSPAAGASAAENKPADTAPTATDTSAAGESAEKPAVSEDVLARWGLDTDEDSSGGRQ